MAILSDAEKAAAAQRLLHDPILAEALDAIEKDAINGITFSDPKEKELREQCYFKIMALQALREELKAHITQQQLNERAPKR